jgi:hypothetical protein
MVVIIGVVGSFAACSSGAKPAAQPKVPTFASSTTASTPAAPELTAVPKGCDQVAQAADVDKIVGHQLPGTMAPVVGVPEAAINRTARLDCYYGIPQGQPVTAAAIGIGIASYADPTSAQHGVQVTITSARDTGYATNDVQVAGQHAVLLAGPQNQELVLAHANLTVLISAVNGVLPVGKVGPPLMALAVRALTAH